MSMVSGQVNMKGFISLVVCFDLYEGETIEERYLVATKCQYWSAKPMSKQETEKTRVPMAKTSGLLKLSAATPMNKRVVEKVATKAGPTRTYKIHFFEYYV